MYLQYLISVNKFPNEKLVNEFNAKWNSWLKKKSGLSLYKKVEKCLENNLLS